MINCILIDDDAAVAAGLRAYIAQLPFLNLLASFVDAAEGLLYLETNPVGLLFTDISMPGMDGMALTRVLRRRFGAAAPQVIFITGCPEYAVEGYEVEALDFVVKPVSFERFALAASKAKAPAAPELIFLRVEQELVRVRLTDILYMESDRDHVKVFLAQEDTVLKALSTLKDIEERLPPTTFLRVHRSFIVALDKIVAIQHHSLRIGKRTIPVSGPYRSAFRAFAERWS